MRGPYSEYGFASGMVTVAVAPAESGRPSDGWISADEYARLAV